MRIFTTDSYRVIFDAIASRLIDAEAYKSLIDKSDDVPLPLPIQELTFDQFAGMKKCKFDEAIIRYYLSIAEPKTKMQKLTAKRFCELLKRINKEVEAINNAFQNIPHPPWTLEQIQAGYDKLYFGDFGIVDRIAQRCHCSDEEAGNMTVASIIGKLTIDGARALCEYKLNDIYKQKMR